MEYPLIGSTDSANTFATGRLSRLQVVAVQLASRGPCRVLGERGGERQVPAGPHYIGCRVGVHRSCRVRARPFQRWTPAQRGWRRRRTAATRRVAAATTTGSRGDVDRRRAATDGVRRGPTRCRSRYSESPPPRSRPLSALTSRRTALPPTSTASRLRYFDEIVPFVCANYVHRFQGRIQGDMKGFKGV